MFELDILFPLQVLLLKAICFVNSICTIFSVSNKVPLTKPFQASQSWHQLSVLVNKVLVQTLFTKWMDFISFIYIFEIFLAQNRLKHSHSILCSKILSIVFRVLGIHNFDSESAIFTAQLNFVSLPNSNYDLYQSLHSTMGQTFLWSPV